MADWWRWFRCDVMGWHRSLAVQFDGASFIGWCDVCGRRCLQDSWAGWFEAAPSPPLEPHACGISVLEVAIPMLLPCPRCHALHVDAPEPERGWTNPPHRSHLCHYCGLVWRPADVPTTGVAAITTRGAADTWPASGVDV